MNIDKMRMDFEVWECVADEGPQTDPAWLMFDEKTNTFPLDKIQERWRVWQASRAAIEVELPSSARMYFNGAPAEAYTDGIKCWHGGVDACRVAIESAGLKVKP